jgi:hypothetical protein
VALIGDAYISYNVMNKDQTLIKIEKWLNIIGDSLDSPIWKDGTFVYEKITVKHVAYL